MADAQTGRTGIKTRAVATAAGLALLVAIVGGLSTDLGPWYTALDKPDWQPPSWLFGPAWTFIYACTAAAGVLAWLHSDSAVGRQNVIIWFLFNAVLNVTWSLLFFRIHRPDWALTEVALLWLSIVVLILLCRSRSKLAVALLLPYLLWVTFAAALNAEIVRLNGPFAGA